MTANTTPHDRSTDTAAVLEQPTPPFKQQHQPTPGLESQLDPAPKYEARRYRPANKLEGQTAIVTGGESGIGRAGGTHLRARRRGCRDRLPAGRAVRRRVHD